MTSVPAAREDHSATWTGTEMIVWGGYSGIYFEFTGGRYNPALDSWAPTSVSGAPTGRLFNSTVWTGTEMIIWGGNDGQTLANGGRYDPVANSWSSVSTVNAPAERIYHSAVWSGSRMVVWGGKNGAFLKTGGRYDPVTDSWEDTSLDAVPSLREKHTSVWTGSFMLMWGGFAGPHFNTGGRYVPEAVLGEAANLVFASDGETISWGPAPGATGSTTYDVARGLADELPVGAGAAEVCHDPGTALLSTTDSSTPSSGDSFWYLVRGADSCGNGSYGNESGGAERDTSICP
jgi:hypothetical protein